MANPLLDSEQYDEIYSAGGYEGVYNLPYYHSMYYPLFKRVLREARLAHAANILDVGCGNGSFLQLLLKKYPIGYRGFDFSAKAVELAGQRTGKPELFFVGDAYSKDSYASPYDCIVCTEVLEHLENDLEIIKLWKPGTTYICSVPNFNAATHKRFFTSSAQVKQRYGSLMHIRKIVEVSHPGFANLSIRNYARQLRGSLGRPGHFFRQMALMLGLRSSNLKWFLFVGEGR